MLREREREGERTRESENKQAAGIAASSARRTVEARMQLNVALKYRCASTRPGYSLARRLLCAVPHGDHGSQRQEAGQRASGLPKQSRLHCAARATSSTHDGTTHTWVLTRVLYLGARLRPTSLVMTTMHLHRLSVETAAGDSMSPAVVERAARPNTACAHRCSTFIGRLIFWQVRRIPSPTGAAGAARGGNKQTVAG